MDAAIATTVVVRWDLGGGGGGGDGEEEPFPLAAAAAPDGAVVASGEREARGAFWPFPLAIGEGRRQGGLVCALLATGGISRARERLLAEVVASLETGEVGTRDPPGFHV